MNAKVCLGFRLHRQYRDEHDEPLWVVEFASSDTISDRVRELGYVEELFEGRESLSNPLRIEFGCLFGHRWFCFRCLFLYFSIFFRVFEGENSPTPQLVTYLDNPIMGFK